MKKPILLTAVMGGKKKTYAEQIAAMSPVIHWKCDETSGTAAVNYGTAGSAANGVYAGVTLAQVAGPNGKELYPFFDGINDTLAYAKSSSFPAWNQQYMDVGTLAGWFKVYDLGVWTDGVRRNCLTNVIDYSPRNFFSKWHVNNQFGFSNPSCPLVGTSTTDWFHFVVSWNRPENSGWRTWNGGTKELATSTQAWTITNYFSVGVLGFGENYHHGYCSNIVLFDRQITDAEAKKLYTGGLLK